MSHMYICIGTSIIIYLCSAQETDHTFNCEIIPPVRLCQLRMSHSQIRLALSVFSQIKARVYIIIK